MERAARPLPHPPDRRGGLLLRGRRPLPLGLGGQARVVRSGEGVGLEPGDVAGGRLGVPRRDLRVIDDVVLLLPGPALVRPPLAPLVAAALAEAHPAGVADRQSRDLEGGMLDRVARALVVVGETLRGRADRERAGGQGDPLALLVHRRQRPIALGQLAGGQQPGDRHRLAHRLCVLELVAEHHLADRPVAEPLARERRGGAGADGSQIVARRGRPERLDFPAHRARRLERVVQLGQIRAQQLQARVAMSEPQVLVGGDVTEIPDERAHDRRVHALEIRVADSRDQRERARARLLEVGERPGQVRGCRRADGGRRCVLEGGCFDMASWVLTRSACSL